MDIEEEIWKDIKGFEGCYQISNLGRVKSLMRLIPYKTSDGIIKHHHVEEKILNVDHNVNLYKKGVHVYRKISNLMAETFLDNPNGYKNVLHIKGKDNKLDNIMFSEKGCSRGMKPKKVKRTDKYGEYVVYDSIQLAAAQNNTSNDSIRKACLRDYLYFDYIWQFVD